MATLFSDDFNRADSSSIGTSYSFDSEPSDNFTILSNKLRATGSATGSPYRVYVNTVSVADMKVSADISDGGVTAWARTHIVVRRVDANNYYLVYYGGLSTAQANLQICKIVGGSLTVLAASSYFAHSSGSTIAFSVQGTSLKAYYNGVEKVSATNGDITAAGNPGLYSGLSNTETVNYDNLLVEDFGGVVASYHGNGIMRGVCRGIMGR